MRKKVNKKKRTVKVFIGIAIVIVIVAITGMIVLNRHNLKINHEVLSKLENAVLWTDTIGKETNKKIYVSVYDGKKLKRYESAFSEDLSQCLLEVEKKIHGNIRNKSVRLDITSETYKEDYLLEMANNINTLSYYYSNGNVYPLVKYGNGKARNLDTIDIKKDIIIETYNYMLKQIQDDGMFVYGYYLNSGTIPTEYNVIRHAGSLWSMLDTYAYLYNKDGNKKELDLMKKVYDAIYKEYLLEKDENTYFIRTDGYLCQIGSNALTMLAALRLHDITDDSKYLDDSIRLANGILYLQNDDGSFYHLINTDFEKDGKNHSVIYSGEIHFALLKLYEKTKDEVYLNTVLKSMDYFIGVNNVETKNHWFSYAYAEIIKYVKDYKYMKNFLEDMNQNLDSVDRELGVGNMEYLGSCYEFLTQVIRDYDEFSLNGIISKEELNVLLERVRQVYTFRAQRGLSNYATIENSMFFDNMNTYIGSFFMNDYFARIDISQHNLSGYLMFYDYLYLDSIRDLEFNDACVNLAKQAIETYIKTGETIPVPDNLPKEMYENCKNGVFIGIHNGTVVRGCQGSFSATGVLAEEIIRFAIITATEDKRYSHIQESELKDLTYEVSILGEPIKVNDISELDAKKYGIIIKKDGKKAMMLPDRPTIPTVEDQIRKTLKKAGLAENEKDYELYKFSTTVYKSR